MADSQKMGKAKSGGQRIDDHSFWAGKGNDETPFPKGVHTKKEMSAEGAGSEMNYEDTSAKIKDAQDFSVRKAKAHEMKPLHRN